MTQALSVRCQNCGSSLAVGEGIRFITCAYCHSELQVVRDASTVHTEVLHRIEQNTVTTVNQLKVIEIQNEIERLDREWEMWRERSLDRSKDGAIIEPLPPFGMRAVFIGAGIVAVFLASMAMITQSWIGFLIAAIIVPAIIMGTGFVRETTARHFESARMRYENMRTVLLHRLDSARGTSRN